MKRLTKIAIGTALVLLVLPLAVPPASASCGVDFTISTGNAYLVSNPDWVGAGAVSRVCGANGCLESEAPGVGPPINPDGIKGFFWGLGGGNPAPTLGADNGAFTVDMWTKQASVDFGAPYGVYHYPAWMTLDNDPAGGDFPNSRPGDTPNWSLPGIDGCITSVDPDPADPNVQACQCVVLADQWDNTGYFVVLSDEGDPSQNFRLVTGQTDGAGASAIRFAPLPRPRVINTNRDMTTALFEAALPDASAGIFQEPGCNCIAGFRVYGKTRGATGDPGTPVDLNLNTGWTPLNRADGSAQLISALDAAPIGLRFDGCDETASPGTELLIAIGLELDSGFTLPIVSAPALFSCSADFAEPDRPGRRPFDPRPDRGRDSDRPTRRNNR